MPNTIPEKNSVKIDQKEQLLETRVMLLEERLKEMEKILTTLNPFQKVDQAPNLIHVLRQLAQIEVLAGTKMDPLNPKQVNGKERNECFTKRN